MGRLYDAYVEVGPKFTGFGEIKKEGDKAGQAYGKSLGEAAAKAAQANVKKLGDALSKARASEADAAGKVRVAEAKLEEARKKTGDTSARTIAAEEALASAVRKSATASDVAKSAADSLDAARTKAAKKAEASGQESGTKFGAGLKSALSRVRTDDAGSDAGSRFGIGFSKQIPAIGGRITSFFKAGAGAAVGLAAGALVGGSFIAGFQEALNQGDVKAKFQGQLGLSDADAAKAGKIAGDLYKANYGESLGGVNDAIKSVVQNTNVGLNSVDLKPVTAKVLNLASTFDQDLGGVTRATGQLIRTGLAKDATQALDIITKGFQSGADKSEDFLDTLNEYGTQFRKVGLDGATATGLISQGLKAGARDGDLVADSIKEFSIRAIDGSKSTSAGFKAIGLDAEKMAAQIAKGGKPAAEGLDLVLDRLRNIKDPVKQSQAAVALFGTQAEDLGAALFALDPSNAVKAIGDVSGAAGKLDETLGSTPKAIVTSFFRSLKQNSVDNLGAMIKAFMDGEKTAGGFVGFLQTTGIGARKVFDELKGGVLSFSAAFKANDGDITSSGFPGFMEKLGFAARQAFDYFKSDVLPVLKDLGRWIRDDVLPALFRFGGYLADVVFPIVRRVVTEGLSGFKAGLDNVRTAFEDNKPQLETFVTKIGDIVKWVSQKLGPILGWLAGTQMKFVYGQIAKVITGIGFFVDAIGWLVRTTQDMGTKIAAVWSAMRTNVDTAWTGIKRASTSALGFLVRKFLEWGQDIIDGAANAFSWVPGIGDKLKGAQVAFKKFRDDVNNKLAGINDEPVNIKVDLAYTQALGQKTKQMKFATGGPVFGAGTATSDSIPAMLSNNEHVWTAKEVQAAGGHKAVESMRKHAVRGYATGGGVLVNASVPSARRVQMMTNRAASDVDDFGTAMAKSIAKKLADQAMGPGGPPGARKAFRGVTLNTRTIGMLLNAERILGRMFHITQGSYSTSVAASGGTHSGGGAMDTNGPGGWSTAVSALRKSGFAAWHRTPSQGPWGHHIHSIALGDSSASPAAKNQMAAYRRGGDGLGHGMARGGRVLLRDQGGPLPHGSMALNLSGKTETVVPGGGTMTVNLSAEDRQLLRMLRDIPIQLDGRRVDEGFTREAMRR